MNNKLFTFIRPYLSFIDKGDFFRKPFSWLYIVLAILNLAFPLYILYECINGGVFSLSFKYTIAILLLWLGIVAAGWFGFQIWWDRNTKVLKSAEVVDDIVAIPGYTHFIQTFGEWLGMWVAVVGCWFSIIGLIFGAQLGMLASLIGVGFFEVGIVNIILYPLYGFFIVVTTRAFAELFRAVANIAHNTKK